MVCWNYERANFNPVRKSKPVHFCAEADDYKQTKQNVEEWPKLKLIWTIWASNTRDSFKENKLN